MHEVALNASMNSMTYAIYYSVSENAVVILSVHYISQKIYLES